MLVKCNGNCGFRGCIHQQPHVPTTDFNACHCWYVGKYVECKPVPPPKPIKEAGIAEREANAQLIAAAPAMYEALKDTDLIYEEIMAQVNPELRVQVATFFTGLLNAKDKAEGKWKK